LLSPLAPTNAREAVIDQLQRLDREDQIGNFFGDRLGRR